MLLTVGIVCAIADNSGCYRNRGLRAWTTGEPGAPPDVAAVYRAVLDQIFLPGTNGPSLVVIRQMTEPSMAEVRNPARPPGRISSVAIAPFSYRLPITFIDSASLRDLRLESRKADSIAYTVTDTDIRYRQRGAGPFLQRFPGAWGQLTLSRVTFGPARREASVDVQFESVVLGGELGDELFRLVRTRNEWKVEERVVRDEMIRAEPLPYVMLHAWVDSSLFPAPRRKSVRGTVKDSDSGSPLAGILIRMSHTPVGSVDVPWRTVFTDARGDFAISDPPSDFVTIRLDCPPSRDVPGAELAGIGLNKGSAVDTVLNFRVRFASCAELAPAMAQEVVRHREDVKRAKIEAAARAVQGNIWGTLRDSRTGRPVPRSWIRVDERGGLGVSDSAGHFWLWGFAPGKHKIIVYCHVRRQWFGKVATTLAFKAPPSMRDTMDITVDTRRCTDVPVDTVQVRTRGVLSEGFEDGFFTACKPFNQIQLGGYRDFSSQAWLGFAAKAIGPPGGWPEVKPQRGYYKIFLDVEGNLIGPGSYGHLGMATYQLIVTRVFSARAASKRSCHPEQSRDSSLARR